MNAPRTSRPLLAAAIATLLACAGFCAAVNAAAPLAKTQAPGYYRMMLGVEVTAPLTARWRFRSRRFTRTTPAKSTARSRAALKTGRHVGERT
jgi:hypothetical protein